MRLLLLGEKRELDEFFEDESDKDEFTHTSLAPEIISIRDELLAKE